MHQLPFPRFSPRSALALVAIAIAVAAACAAAARPFSASAQATGVVSVVYAGSLVTPMEGPMKAALQARGVTFQGEPGGSKKLANFIVSGVRSPDAFISVDPSLVKALGPRVESATTFAGTSLGVGWSSGSKFSVQLGAAAGGRQTLQSVLSTSGISIGRTDPQLDPKGAYTISAVRSWLGDEGERTLLGADENPAQIFPEEDLLARIETGQADVGFFYRTEALARHLHFIPLPGNASMSSKITYTLAVLAHSPHPQQARAFADFVLRGPGRAILERAGLTYFDPAIRVDIP